MRVFEEAQEGKCFWRADATDAKSTRFFKMLAGSILAYSVLGFTQICNTVKSGISGDWLKRIPPIRAFKLKYLTYDSGL